MAKKFLGFIVASTALVQFVLITIVLALPGAAKNPEPPELQEHMVESVDLELAEQKMQAELMYVLSNEELEALARLVWNESGTCGDECQRAIISVTLNQLAAGYWGDSYMGILTNPSIYVGALYLETAKPDRRVYDNIDYVLTYGITVPNDVCYFRARYGWEEKWAGYETIAVIDDVYFGHFVNDHH